MSSATRGTARKASKSDYIETESGNKVSRKAALIGTPNIILAGCTVLMPDVILRGDIVRARPAVTQPQANPDTTTNAAASGETNKASKPSRTGKSSSVSANNNKTAISIGKYSVFATGTILRPPTRLSRGVWTPYPLKIGDHVLVGPGCLISAALIHHHVQIGARCILQPFCIIRENVNILDDSVVPAGMTIPPGVVVAGRPARIVADVGEGYGVDGVGQGWVEGGDLRQVVRNIR